MAGASNDSVNKDGSAYGRAAGTHDAELTEVGPGTPCGEFMRCYWQPIAVSARVTERPQNVRILGEDLVVFRDGNGRPGLLTPRCAHRGASLYYGRVEEQGIRCCYHGWLFDVEGRCLDQPCEPDGGARIRERIRQPWYPVEELYGLVFAYMGPPEKKPVLPRWDILEDLPADETVFATDSSFSVGGDDSVKILPWSWLQDWENSTDPFHVYILHTSFSGEQFAPGAAVKPVVTWEYTDLGIHYKAYRKLPNGREFDRVQPLLFPNVMSVPDIVELEPGPATGMGWAVPVDDTHHRRFHAMRVPRNLTTRPKQMYTEKRPKPWLQMNEEERQRHPSDWEAQMSQGPITLHSEEHLVTSDKGIAMIRRRLREQIRLVQQGGDPIGVTFDPKKAVYKAGAGNFYRTAAAPHEA
jgi:phenylpropionate dioxygenase-like ring-hydroxylating dioxygenase large terminal subunit